MALVLAIDLGTTNLKTGVVNAAGKILAFSTVHVPTTKDESGKAVHKHQEIKKLILEQGRKVLAQIKKEDIKYIVSSSYHFGLMMLDEHKSPVTEMTLLTDTRSQRTFTEFIHDFGDKDLYHKTGCPFINQYVLPRLYYFSKEENEILRKAKYFHDSKSFLFEWLTGEWKTDYSTASSAQFLNMHTLQWDEKILSALKLRPDQFPQPVDGTQHLAPIRKEISEDLGLGKDVKVALGLYDGGALGAGLSDFKPEVAIINLGTTLMLRVPCDHPVPDKNENKRIQSYTLKKGMLFNGGALNNAALPIDWMRSNLFEFDDEAAGLADIPEGSPLMALPYLTGERDSQTGPFASGVFFGIRRQHTKTDFVRAVLEGVAYSTRLIFDALKENQLVVKEIRMGGGGVNIQAWPQMFADTLGVPIMIPKGEEIALVGSAMIAYTADGYYKTLDEASQNMMHQGKRIEPNADHLKLRNHYYQFFKNLKENMDPMFTRHASL